MLQLLHQRARFVIALAVSDPDFSQALVGRQIGQTQAHSTPFAVRTLVAEVADLFAPPAHHKDLEIGWTAEMV